MGWSIANRIACPATVGLPWSGQGTVLADTSAWIVARRVPEARQLLLAAVQRGDVAWCWPVRYELMVDARGTEGIAAIDRSFEGLREIAVDRGVQRGVLSAMRELAATSSHGARRLPLADLTVAVAAQQAWRSFTTTRISIVSASCWRSARPGSPEPPWIARAPADRAAGPT